MTRHNSTEDKLVCSNCGRDTFAVRRDNGLEVKYRDRWALVLNDAVGTVLFRCRFCEGMMAYRLDGSAEGLPHPTRHGRHRGDASRCASGHGTRESKRPLVHQMKGDLVADAEAMERVGETIGNDIRG